MGYLPDIVVPVTTRTRLLCQRPLSRSDLCSPPLHFCPVLLGLLARLVLRLLFGLAFHLHLGSLRLLSCSCLHLFTRSSLHHFPALFLLFLDLLALTPLLRFGIEDGRLVFTTGLELRCCRLGPVIGLNRRGGSGGGGLSDV